MKSFCLILLLLSPFTHVSAQSHLDSKLYIDFGSSFMNHLSINKKLVKNDLEKITPIFPGIDIGIEIAVGNFMSNVSAGLMLGRGENAENVYKLNGFAADLFLGYKIFGNRNVLNAGLEMNYIPISLELFSSKSNAINLNNFQPKTATGVVELYNRFLMIGPSLTYGNLLSDSDSPISVTLSYLININKERWQSEYTTIDNSIREHGSMFNIRILMPILP